MKRVTGLAGLQQAFDEVRFGGGRTLNLRASMPTGAEAARRLESWLREQQVQRAPDVLVITGAGNNSEGGVSVVRETCIRVFHELRRKNVITTFNEHTSGSFIVELAPMSAMLEAGKRRREHDPLPPPANPPTLAALSDETRDALRILAERSLDSMGMKVREPFMQDEMLRLFSRLAGSIPSGPGREASLRAAIVAAMTDYD